MRWSGFVLAPFSVSVAFRPSSHGTKFQPIVGNRPSGIHQRPKSLTDLNRSFCCPSRKHEGAALPGLGVLLANLGNYDQKKNDEPPRNGTSRGAIDRLKGYGLAGLIAYGLLNQLFYSATFAFLWLGPMGATAIVTPVTGGLGGTFAVSVKQFGKVAVLVWLGSQATKPVRIALAVILAPAAERVLQSTERRLGLPSRQRAFWTLFAAILASTVTFCATAVTYATFRTAASGPTGSPASSVALLLSHGGRRSGRHGFGDEGWIWRLTQKGSENVDFPSGASSRRRGPLVVRRLGGLGVPGDSTPFSQEADLQTKREGIRMMTTRCRRHVTITKTVVSSTREEWSPRIGEEDRGRRISPQKAADMNPPPQDNVHGWNEHPNYLLGLWRVGDAQSLPAPDDSWADEAIAAAAPSLAAAEVLAAAMSDPSNQDYGSEQGEHQAQKMDETHDSQASPLEEGYSYRETANRDMIDLGSDILHHVRHVVLRRGGNLKAGPAELGVAPRSWRFTPANRRLVLEVDVPGRGVTLRYSGKIKRLPGRFTRVAGNVRVRPMSHASGDREMPPSSRLWPKLAGFTMEKDKPSKTRHKKSH